MRRVLIILMFSIMSGNGVLFADEILSADNYFHDGITVIDELPIVRVNHDTHVIEYYNPDIRSWTTYPFPTSEQAVSPMGLRENDKFLFTEVLTNDPTEYLSKNLWELDLQTGEYGHPASVGCNNIIFPDLLDKTDKTHSQRWVIIQDMITSTYTLCDTKTGEQSPTIPEQYEIHERCYVAAIGIPYPSVINDDRWVVFHSCDAEHNYLYDIETSQFSDLGNGGNFLDTEVIIQDSLILFHNPLKPEQNQYIADANHAGSLTLVHSVNQSDLPIYESDENVTITSASPIFVYKHNEDYQFVVYSPEEQKLLEFANISCTFSDCYDSPRIMAIHPELPLIIFEANWLLYGANYETQTLLFTGLDHSFITFTGINQIITYDHNSSLIYDFWYADTNTTALSWDTPPVSVKPIVSLDSKYLITRSRESANIPHQLTMGIADLETRKFVGSFTMNRSWSYFNLQWQDDNTIIVTYYEDFEMPSSRWHIQLDAIEDK